MLKQEWGELFIKEINASFKLKHGKIDICDRIYIQTAQIIKLDAIQSLILDKNKSLDAQIIVKLEKVVQEIKDNSFDDEKD